MQGRFLSNLFLLLTLNLLVKPVYILGIDAEVQSRLGTEEYGVYFGLVNLSFLLNFILDFGINNYNTRKVAQSGNVVVTQFSGMIMLRLALAFCYMLLLVIVGIVLGYKGYSIFLLSVLGINQVFAAFLLFFRSNLSGLHLFKQDSLMSVLDRLLLIILVGTLLFTSLLGDGFKIEWFIYAQTTTYGLSALVAFLLVARHIPRIKLNWQPDLWKKLLISSSPYALLTLMMMAYHRSDGVMLERMLNDDGHQAGIYARGYRFFEAASMIAYLFAVLLLPMFTRSIQRNEKVEQLVNVSFRILFSGAWTLGILCFFFANELLSLRYNDLLSETSEVFAVLMLGFIAFATTYIYGTLITAKGDMRTLNLLAFGGLILNLILNLLLIPEYGAFGSAIATLITQSLAALSQFIAAKTIFKLRNNNRLLLGVLSFSAFTLIAGYWLKEVNINWLSRFTSLLLTSLLLAWLSGLLPIKATISMLKERLGPKP